MLWWRSSSQRTGGRDPLPLRSRLGGAIRTTEYATPYIFESRIDSNIVGVDTVTHPTTLARRHVDCTPLTDIEPTVLARRRLERGTPAGGGIHSDQHSSPGIFHSVVHNNTVCDPGLGGGM